MKPKQNKCVIVGASGEGYMPEKFPETDFIIAADAGMTALKENNITPNIILGDFDSLGVTPDGENVIKLPVAKDDTDMGYAVKKAIALGMGEIEIYRCLGGERFDHSIATLQMLAYIADKGLKCKAFGDVRDGTYLVIETIKNGTRIFPENMEGTVSVFSFNGKAEGVNIKNLLYTLDNGELLSTFPLGVSNSFISGKKGEISVENGILGVIYREKIM